MKTKLTMGLRCAKVAIVPTLVLWWIILYIAAKIMQ